MKNKFLITVIFLMFIFTSSIQAQNPETILKKSFNKCQSIKNGYYEMKYYLKLMSRKDTLLQTYKCYFQKLKNDSIYSSAFHYEKFSNNKYKNDVLYTGDDFVYYSKNDSSGTIMSKKLWAKDIKSFSHNYTFYTPVTDKDSRPLPKDSAFSDKRNIFEYIGEEIINNMPSYHIRMREIPENDSTEVIKIIRTEFNFWINKKDYIPVQFTIAYDMVMNNDTMYQFQKKVLTKHEFNNLKNQNLLKLTSIPAYINLKDYKPYKSPELLQKNTIAPNWTLTSLQNKTIKLSDYKGKLVLIDFFYKSCYPCMLALPELQELHEKYYDKGLRIIGIDPYDTKEKDEIDKFLAKRGITYTVFLDGKDVAKQYHVSGYPTMYLIDKNGKIITIQVGYEEGVKDELEKIIKENL